MQIAWPASLFPAPGLHRAMRIGIGLQLLAGASEYNFAVNKLEIFGLIAAQAERGEIIFPTSVNAALRLQLALDDPECHIENAIKLVLGEPQLAARTVALANSAAFNRNGEAVTNVRAAVMRIGYRSLQMLVAGLVVRQFGSRIVDPQLRAKAEQLWQHTAHVAALAKVFARRVTFINSDTALFAAIVHEVGGFYLLSRADEFPGLLDDDPENWIQLCEEVVSREVMRKLAIPATVMDAIQNLRSGLMGMPPSTLLDTLLLANQFAPVHSPLALEAPAQPAHHTTALDIAIDRATLDSILQESADEFQLLSAALLV
jgi:HD-like signal output (HDOD) protein